ncbi:MAG: cupin domain-containing protein [Desulfobacteraceae bacterium]|jgi:quercetin dioxygenase-like cupin family protein
MSYFLLKEVEAKKPAEGVEIRVIPGERMTMAFFRLESGTKIPEHAHPHEQMGTVLKGSVELVIGEEKRVVKEGCAYRVPPDVLHSGMCLESSSEVLEVFSPPREDLQ